MSTSIFQGDRILGNRRLIGGTGILASPTDPLASIPSLLDLRTHRGDKVPSGINPTANGTNAIWQGVTGSATQPLAAAQPLTKFASDGTPYLDFDGVDDWMSVGVMPRQVTYSILARSGNEDYFEMYSSFIDSADQSQQSVFPRWALFENPGNRLHFNPTPVFLRIDGVQKDDPLREFDYPINIFRSYTIKTYLSNEEWVRGIAQYFQQYFAKLDVIALFIHDGEPTTDQIVAVERFHQRLQPDPLAQYDFVLRLQTHKGDRIPLGLYQDTACTIPATQHGHPVGGWKDILGGSGLIATQSVSTKRPTLIFEDSVPMLHFDGVDDCLIAPLTSEMETTNIAVSCKLYTESVWPVLIGAKEVVPSSFAGYFIRRGLNTTELHAETEAAFGDYQVNGLISNDAPNDTHVVISGTNAWWTDYTYSEISIGGQYNRPMECKITGVWFMGNGSGEVTAVEQHAQSLA